MGDSVLEVVIMKTKPPIWYLHPEEKVGRQLGGRLGVMVLM